MNELLPNSPGERPERSLKSVMKHIVKTHHSFCRQEITSISLLMKNALSVHRKDHPELTKIQMLFLEMSKDLTMHMLKEEETLFPYIEQVENTIMQGGTVRWPPFGSVESPVRMMILEHVKTSNELSQIRELSSDFTSPADASEHVIALYNALAAFDQDMQRHIEVENNELFPRAVVMEGEACAYAEGRR